MKITMGSKLANGAHSDVYLGTDEEHGAVIIKVARATPGSEKADGYIDDQLAGDQIVKEIRNSGMDFGVVLPEIFGVADTEYGKAIVERPIKGVDFKDGVYNALDEAKKEDAARQIALFLNAMHQMRAPQPADKSIKNLFVEDPTEPHTADQFAAVFEGQIPPAYMERIAAAQRALDGYDIGDEYHVMTHKDLRYQNIMYDTERKRVAVIDFEMAGVDNIYRDFVAIAPASSMPWDFTRRVIKHYNKIENKKYPITINPDKVKNALIFGAAQSYSRVLQYDKNDNIKVNVTERATRLVQGLNRLIGIDELFDANKARTIKDKMERATAMVRQKNDAVTIAAALKILQDENG